MEGSKLFDTLRCTTMSEREGGGLQFGLASFEVNLVLSVGGMAKKTCSHEGCTNNAKKGGIYIRHGANDK